MATCIVSGTLLDSTGTAIDGATVKAFVVSPYIYGATMIGGKLATTTTDAAGLWTMTLNETFTVTRSIIIEFQYADGASGLIRQSFSIIVPNQTSADFSTLVTLP